MLLLLPLREVLQTTRFCVDKALTTQYILYPLKVGFLDFLKFSIENGRICRLCPGCVNGERGSLINPAERSVGQPEISGPKIIHKISRGVT